MDKTEEIETFLIEPSYFTDNNFHIPFLREVGGCIGRQNLAALKYLAFILLKPDAVASGKTMAVIKLLVDKGFEIVDVAVCLRAEARQFEDLYRYNLTLYNQQNMVSSWWLNCQVYGLGPVVTLLVADRGSQDFTVHERLAKLKGSSSPYHCRPGQFRFDLGACNRSINLIHSADDPLSTAREFLVFHPASKLQSILRDFQAGERAREGLLQDSWKPSIELKLELSMLAPAQERIDFISVLTRIKQRIRSMLWDAGCYWGERGELLSLYLDYEYVACDEAGLLERTRRFRDLGERERRCLEDSGVAAGGDAGALAANLCNFNGFTFELADSCIRFLHYNRIYISPWEELILRTSMYYFDDCRSVLM